MITQVTGTHLDVISLRLQRLLSQGWQYDLSCVPWNVLRWNLFVRLWAMSSTKLACRDDSVKCGCVCRLRDDWFRGRKWRARWRTEHFRYHQEPSVSALLLLQPELPASVSWLGENHWLTLEHYCLRVNYVVHAHREPHFWRGRQRMFCGSTHLGGSCLS